MTPGYIIHRRRIGFLFFLPILLHLTLFLAAPIATAIAISFTKYAVMTAPKWVGLRNYARIFTTPSFYNALKVTGQYVVMRVAALLVFAFIMALLASRKYPARGIHQSIFFLPFVVPLAVTSIIWKLLYQPFGLIESILAPLGIGPISWLTSADVALVAITISTVWSASGGSKRYVSGESFGPATGS